MMNITSDLTTSIVNQVEYADALKQGLAELVENCYSLMQQDNVFMQANPFSAIHVYAECPRLGLTWQKSMGYTSLSKQKKAHINNPLRIASNTKTFVAAAVLRLWEDGALNLDGSIREYISKQHAQMLEQYGYRLASLSSRHLLTHTSGLFDYADSTAFQQALIDSPQYHWTRTEQLALALTCGKAYGLPGEVYRYSDTGYILLGEIIESILGISLGNGLRDLIGYEKLGLKSTWMEGVEPQPKLASLMLEQYIGTRNAKDIHPSCDIYGGGGLVSTVVDMTTFLRALFEHQVFKHADTLNEMLTTVPAIRGGPVAYASSEQIPETYCLGLERSHQGRVYSHTGYLGTCAGYISDADFYFGYSVNQHGSGVYTKKIFDKIVGLIKAKELKEFI